MQAKLKLEQALRNAEFVMVARDAGCWPPKFAVTIISPEHGPLTFRDFLSRSAAWEAVEDVSSITRPIPKPDQDQIDNTRFPWDEDCEGGERKLRVSEEPLVIQICIHCGRSQRFAEMYNSPNCTDGARKGQPHEWETETI